MESDKKKFSVNPEAIDSTVKDTVEYILTGNRLLEMPLESVDENIKLSYINSIILKPDYQREYRFSIVDESSLIESILVGIPIPPVFLCTARYKGVKVRDVVDGQHRLKAFYRFRENCFKLTKLPLLSELNGKTFNDLSIEYKEKILSYKLSTYVFNDFPGKDFELEVFNRYNKGSKALTSQEIRNAVYSSPYNEKVSSFAEKLYKDPNSYLAKVYNVTKDRYLKKKVHEGIFTILYVLDNGINEKFKDSTEYADEYMKEKSLFTNHNFQAGKDTVTDEDLKRAFNQFKKFNEWLEKWSSVTSYPLSKEIYGISSKSYKFQTSMALIIPAIYRKIHIINEVHFDSFEQEKTAIQKALQNSYLEDSAYTASSTNSKAISALIKDFH